MKLSEIQKQWRKDSKIDPENLHTEVINIPSLHSKYYNILLREKSVSKMLELEYNKMKKIKRDYYLGRLPRKVIEEMGWEVVNHENRPSDMKDILDGDIDLCRIEEKISFHHIKIDFLKEIISTLNHRGYQIKTAIEWIKFRHGEF